MKAQLIDLGRGKVNKTVTVKDKTSLHREIQKHIASRNWDMEDGEEENVYIISSGFRPVGTVKILED